ncbi:thermonuclease family protein [Phyllobacterium sp. TAF24]|uniref:thermonuclease family protein n=1 Tax=Phyllobacterium sp. TAF24 TaxID=3233068 RepID=UPI003F9E2BC9
MSGRFRGYHQQRQARPPRSFARKLVDFILMLVFFALVALLAARLSIPRDEQEITGKAYVIDGDTIVLTGKHIRLKGIDAPELAQRCGEVPADYPCGQVARRALDKLISGRAVRCEITGQDKYKRELGTCFASETNLNSMMVEAGQATSYGAYYDEEMRAKVERKGLWAGSFDRPQDWRKVHEGSVETSPSLLDWLFDAINSAYDWVYQKLGEFW